MSDEYRRGYIDGLTAARDVAMSRMFERENTAEASYSDGRSHDGAVQKMQGSTAAVICNGITALIQGLEFTSEPPDEQP